MKTNRDERGKPLLDGSAHSDAFQFNLSHSGDVALLAIGRQRCLGVDVEQRRPVPEMEDVARSVFSAAEMAVLAAVCDDGERMTRCFFQMWTGKEAAIKATGMGLSADLLAMTTEPVDPNGGDRFRITCKEHEGPLFGCRFAVADGYDAAVVTDGVPPEVVVYDWAGVPA